MTIDTLAHRGTVPSADWFALRAAIREFSPDLIVLVARKMPRLDEAANLNLASIAPVISDLAIPFSAPFVRGARVALVDDSVNVGSTLRHAQDRLSAHGAAEVRPFALYSRERSQASGTIRLPELQLVAADPVNEQLWREAANQAPTLISSLNKPYDLDFPVLDCVLEMPLRNANELLAYLSQKYGQRAFDVSTAAGREANLHRFSVDCVTTDGVFSKVRLYFDGKAGQVNVVPMAISSPLPLEPTSSAPVWAREVYDRLVEAAGPNIANELRARAALFVDSLLVGIKFLAEVRDVIRPRAASLIDTTEAQLIFGPVVRNLELSPTLVAGDVAERHGLDAESQATQEQTLTASPALEMLWPQIEASVKSRAASNDPLVRAVALIEALADAVGSSDPREYQVNWPHTKDQIEADPYLRLRIGFTAADLISILRQAAVGRDESAWRRTTSKIIDRLIDSGMVVPTIAEFNGRPYRVYRKGESGQREETVDRVLLGALQYGDAGLSPTRLTKVAVITSFLMPISSAARIAPDEGGNVLALDTDVIDSETEIVGYLGRTGKAIMRSGAGGE